MCIRDSLGLGHGVEIHPLKQKGVQRLIRLEHRRRHADVPLHAALEHAPNHGVDAHRVPAPQYGGDDGRQVAFAQHAGADGVVNVVVDIGDVVCPVDQPALGRGGGVTQRVAEDTVAHLLRQVEAAALLFQDVRHPQALLIVGKACLLYTSHKGVKVWLYHQDKYRISAIATAF